MIDTLRKYRFLLLRHKGDSGRVLALFFMMLAAAGLELVGIGLVLPFVALLQRPELTRQSSVLRWLAGVTGIQSQRHMIVLCGAILVAVFVGKNVYLAFTNAIQQRFVYNRVVALARDLLRSYLRRPYPYFLGRNSADLVRSVTMDVNHVFALGVAGVFSVVIEGLTCLVVVVFLVVLEPVAVPVTGVVVGLGSMIFLRRFRRQGTELGIRTRDARSAMLQHATEAFGGVKEAQVIGCVDYFVDQFEGVSWPFANSIRRQQTVNQLPRFTLETMGVVGVVFVSSAMILRGTPIARIVPFLGVLALGVVRLAPSLSRIVYYVSEIRFNKPTIDGLYDDLTAAPPRQSAMTRSPADRALHFDRELRVCDVSYSYPNASANSLDSVSLSIRQGEAVALVGASGAGKTTLADILIGVLEPTKGHLEIDGVRIEASNLRRWQDHVGYIPQHVYLCDDTLRRNVAFGVPDAEIDTARVDNAITLARLEDLVRTLPEGLETKVGERGVRLSGGQRQRIGIARALYLDPSVLVLDEATSALDGVTEQEVVESIESARKDRTLIVIAHRLSTVRFCDRLALMSGGRIVHVGTWDELLKASPEFRQLVELGGTGDTLAHASEPSAEVARTA